MAEWQQTPIYEQEASKIVDLDEKRRKLAQSPNPALGSGNGGGGMDPWQSSVESRLTSLGQDVRDLRKDMNGDFRWTWGLLVAGLIGLGTMMAHGFGWF